jgi:hypothetical protein
MRAPIDFFRLGNWFRSVRKGLCDCRRLFAPGFSDIAAGSAARVSETAISGCGLAVVAGLRHRDQIVSIIEQHRVTVVRCPVIDNSRRAAAAGAIVLLALAKRVEGKIRQTKPLPAAPMSRKKVIPCPSTCANFMHNPD